MDEGYENDRESELESFRRPSLEIQKSFTAHEWQQLILKEKIYRRKQVESYNKNLQAVDNSDSIRDRKDVTNQNRDLKQIILYLQENNCG